MDISVVAAAREDDAPPLEVLKIATTADRLGYREAWIGEGPTWDAFALATAIGMRTSTIALTAGPVSVHVRDPFSIARGASNAAALAGRSGSRSERRAPVSWRACTAVPACALPRPWRTVPPWSKICSALVSARLPRDWRLRVSAGDCRRAEAR
jgi:hypothetical protein